MSQQRRLVVAAIAAIPLIWVLGFLTISRYRFEAARSAEARGEIPAVLPALSQARAALVLAGGSGVWREDARRIHVLEGNTLLGQSGRQTYRNAYIRLLEEALRAYEDALQVFPGDASVVYGVARSLGALEQQYPKTAPSNHTRVYPVLDTYEKAIALCPSSPAIRLSHLAYLASGNHADKLPDAVRDLASVYPPACSYVRKASYYTPEFVAPLMQGLQDAGQKGALIAGPALMYLAAIYRDQGDMASAIDSYRRGMALSQSLVRSHHYLQLGRYYLAAKDFDAANACFCEAIEVTEDPVRDIRFLSSICRREQVPDFFIRFIGTLPQRIVRQYPDIDLYVAQSYMALEQYPLACSVLMRLESRDRVTSESAFLRAEIAAKTEDWDTMELAAQEAVRLDSSIDRYHRLFINSLEKQNKLIQAEVAATHAIDVFGPRDSRWFRYRATLRSRQGDNLGAVRDWQKVLELAPTAGSHYALSRVYERLDLITMAAEQAEKALKLAPDNAGYQRYLARLRKIAPMLSADKAGLVRSTLKSKKASSATGLVK